MFLASFFVLFCFCLVLPKEGKGMIIGIVIGVVTVFLHLCCVSVVFFIFISVVISYVEFP